MKYIRALLSVIVSILLVIFVFPGPENKDRVREVELDVSHVETTHPYGDYGRSRWIIDSPGADTIKICFDERSSLAEGDSVIIRSTYTQFDEHKTLSHKFEGEIVDRYRLDSLAGATVTVRLRDRVIIMLSKQSESEDAWGFKVTSATAYYSEE